MSEAGSPVRRLARAVRDAPERALHAHRRDRAGRAVEGLGAGAVPNLLFLCYGNICRSPFAAAVMEEKLPAARRGSAKIRSAGFFGPGRTPPDAAQAAALRRGVDLSAHRSRLVTESLVRASDCILVMEPRQLAGLRDFLTGVQIPVLVLGDLDPADLAVQKIADPYGKNDRFFDAIYERIARCVYEIVRLSSPEL